MMCQRCNKNQATVHLTEISHNNIKEEIHLCDKCANETGLPYKLQFSLTEMLSSLMEPVISKLLQGSADLKCPDCGMNFEIFHKKSRFGCARDYEVFKKIITPMLEKIHGSAHHRGKTPAGVSVSVLKEKEIIELQRELEKLVKAEEFEKAAEVRDRIKKLKEKNK